MMLSIHRWVGWKHPRPWLLAALVMAVIPVRVVMSPFQRCIFVCLDASYLMVCDGESEDSGVSSLWFLTRMRINSMLCRMFSGRSGTGGRAHKHSRRRASLDAVSRWSICSL